MPKRADRNQPQIVRDLRRAGFSVQSLHTVGDGCPDILVGHQGMNWLFEIKNPEQPPSKRKLSPDEKDFFEEWKGQINIIHHADEAIEIILYWRKEMGLLERAHES